MKPEKILQAINVMNDSFRALVKTTDDKILIRQFILAYDELYGYIISSLSHPEPRVEFDTLQALNLCQVCKELKN